MINAVESKGRQDACATEPAQLERAREFRVFTPVADVYETSDDIVLLADMPGVDEQSVEIKLDKDLLTIRGTVAEFKPEGLTPVFAEYETGGYERTFRISSEIDRERIGAAVKNGVLRLTLPKVAVAKPRKIAVRPG